jgi:hypothetical protein
LLKTAKIEYAIKSAHELMTLLEEKNRDILINLEDMCSSISEADVMYETEAALCDASVKNKDNDEYGAFEAKKKLHDAVHKYQILLLKNRT